MAERVCACHVCVTGDDPPRVVVEHVREHGWHVAGVAADESVPGWAYSIGLWHSFGSPEVCLFGLPVDRAMSMINVVGDRIRDGAPVAVDQTRDDVIAGYDVMVRAVHGSWYRDVFGQALRFYRSPPLPFVQLVWPDRDRRWPWADNVDEHCAASQPSLWLPYDQHPRGVWTRLRHENDWPFTDGEPEQAVFTTKRIMAGELPVVGIVHDEDGDWQFLDGEPTTTDVAALVHLHHLVDDHPQVRDHADLARGEQAWRQADGSWLRSRAVDTP